MSFSPCIIIEGSYLQTFFHSLVVEMACAYLESVLHNFMHGIRLKKAPLSK